MTEREYNELPGVRRSDLWLINDSPEKYLWATTHPEEPTPAMLFGSMAHKLVLEPGTFADEYAVAPPVDRRTKAGREEWERFTQEAAGKGIVTDDDFRRASEMAEKLRGTQAAAWLTGERERPFTWTDEATGEQCKIRCDVVHTAPDGTITVVDYKTAQDARTDAFNGALFRLGYHLQAYMYTEGVMRGLGLSERPDFLLIPQEKKPPYSMNMILIPGDSGAMRAGEETFRELIGILHGCRETGCWYGYTGAFSEPNEAVVPGWVNFGEE